LLQEPKLAYEADVTEMFQKEQAGIFLGIESLSGKPRRHAKINIVIQMKWYTTMAQPKILRIASPIL
jgi:hypothetical protein